jgi:hypothetical protein
LRVRRTGPRAPRHHGAGGDRHRLPARGARQQGVEDPGARGSHPSRGRGHQRLHGRGLGGRAAHPAGLR